MIHLIKLLIFGHVHKWKTIDTAPKDGTQFLAYDIVAQKMAVCRIDEYGIWTVPFDSEFCPLNSEFGYSRENIRFWMPLPEPPEV